MKSDIVYGLVGASWPVILVDEAGGIHNVNPAAVRAFGPSMADGTGTLPALWLPENQGTAAELLARCAGQAAVNVPLKLLGKNKAQHSFLAAISVILDEGKKYFLFQLLPDTAPAAAPASESKMSTSEANLAQKQKLECALQLARTVSLDFNNALTSILGHTSLVLSKMEAKNPWRHSLLEVEKSAAKAAEIANDLAAFSRQEKEVKTQGSGNLNLLLQRNVEMFQAAKLEREVNWTLQLERKLYLAKFDEAKMQQALVKIMENSIEAMGTVGRVILTTKNLELTEPTQDRNAQLAAGTYVCAEIADNGSGIEAGVLPRIFEPFFTTKRGEKHRGLGLAWVYGIVTNQGGAVAVSSEPGSGTSVRVYLPAEKKMVKEDVTPSAADLSGDQTILMVDDEDLLLTMGETILSSYGYKVLTANSGQKALDIISKGEPHIDLLITDLVMPTMSGRELVELVQKLSPSTRVICSSGYVRPSSEEKDSVSFLQKPFTSNGLLIKVKQVFGSGEGSLID